METSTHRLGRGGGAGGSSIVSVGVRIGCDVGVNPSAFLIEFVARFAVSCCMLFMLPLFRCWFVKFDSVDLVFFFCNLGKMVCDHDVADYIKYKCFLLFYCNTNSYLPSD